MIAMGSPACAEIDDLLPSYYDGDLESAEHGRIASHIATCSGCKAALVNLGAAMAALHRLPRPELGDLPDRVRRAAVNPMDPPRAVPRRRWRTTAVVAIAASIALGASAVLGMWYGRRQVPSVGQQLQAEGMTATSEGWLTAPALRERASGRIWLDGRWTDPRQGAGRILSADGMIARDDLWLGRSAAERLRAGQLFQADGWVEPDRFIAERLEKQGLKKTGASWIGEADVSGLRRDGAPIAAERIAAEHLAAQGYIREDSGVWRPASEAERLADEAARLARGEVRAGAGWTTRDALAADTLAAAGFRRDSEGRWHEPEAAKGASQPGSALPAGWWAMAGVPATVRTAEHAERAERALAIIRPGGTGSLVPVTSQVRPLPVDAGSGLIGGWIVHLPVMASGTPAVVAGRVHVSLGGTRVMAVHAVTGKSLWSNALPDDTPSNPVGYGDEDVAYTTGSCTLYTIAGPSGQVLSSSWISSYLHAMPTASGRLLLTTSPEGGVSTVAAIDGRSGRHVWAATLPGEVRTALISAGSRVVGATQDGSLVALQPQTGKEVWRRRLALVSPPVANGDEILVRRLLRRSAGELGETTTIVDAQDGAVRLESLGEPRPVSGLRVRPASAADDDAGVPIAVTEAGHAVPSFGPVATAGRTAVVLSGDVLEARSLADGQVRWRCELAKGGAADGDAPTDPIIAGDLVIVGCLDGRIRAFDLATGASRWSVDAGSPLGSGRVPMLRCQAAVAAGRVYLTTRAGELVCIDTGYRGLSGPRWWGDRS